MTGNNASSFKLSHEELDQALRAWRGGMDLHAPRRFAERGCMDGQDVVRYAPISASAEIVRDEKSDFAPKEVLFPPSETTFHLLEDAVSEPSAREAERPLLLFCRACDIHGVDRLDRIFLDNGTQPEPYHKRRRQRLRFALIECAESMENCVPRTSPS